MIMFAIEVTFIPTDGVENNNDQMQITGIIAKLYMNKIKNTIDKSSAFFQCSCFPMARITMIAMMVIKFVRISHTIDVAQ